MKENKTAQIVVRLTPTERTMIEELTQANHTKFSKTVRRLLKLGMEVEYNQQTVKQ